MSELQTPTLDKTPADAQLDADRKAAAEERKRLTDAIASLDERLKRDEERSKLRPRRRFASISWNG